MRQEETIEGPPDGIGHQPGLVRQQRRQKGGLPEGELEVGGQGARMGALRDPQPAGQDSRQEGQKRGHGDADEDEGGPELGIHEGQDPSRQQGEEGGGRREGPAQIVDHLPTADQRDLGAGPLAPGDSRQAENPGKELPIAPRPAMLARRRDVVAGGIFLHELDIGHQPGAGEDPLEKVVAEDRILGDSSLEGGLESIDIVDALAGERALAEEILIHVGDGKGIGIHAGGAGEDALESRSFASRRQGGGDARLQHAIAGDDPPGLRIELGTVQRMGHLAHEPLHGAAGQPRIGVQGDDVAHARGHRRRAAA